MKIYIFFTSLFVCCSLSPSLSLIQPADAESLHGREEKKLFQMSVAEIDELMAEAATAHTPLAQKIAVYSQRALGTLYAGGSLGEGIDGIYDKDPLIDFSRVDCMTFCEQTLALAISKSYGDALRNLQKIRYRRGTVSFATRNHFVIADWLPHNQWLLKNITGEIGGAQCIKMTKIINRRAFAEVHGLTDTKSIPPPQRISTHYLPKEYLNSVTDRIRGSELMVCITTRESIFASHLGFIIKKDNGSLIFRHASLTYQKVIDEPYDRYCKRLQEKKDIVGAVFIKAREDFTVPDY